MRNEGVNIRITIVCTILTTYRVGCRTAGRTGSLLDEIAAANLIARSPTISSDGSSSMILAIGLFAMACYKEDEKRVEMIRNWIDTLRIFNNKGHSQDNLG